MDLARNVNLNSELAADVMTGLKTHPKYIPSKYFYDATGDRLFQEITELDDYYLTRCEKELLTRHHDRLLELLHDGRPMRLIELGPGDGSKTLALLSSFVSNKVPITYQPVDISAAILKVLVAQFKQALPTLHVAPLQGDYFQLSYSGHVGRKVWLYMGSNIGNLDDVQSLELLSNLNAFANPGDLLCVGYDLKKSPQAIKAAYNDAHGVTRQFNLNLLTRLNRELGADFELDYFDHVPVYDPERGEARSYLISTRNQVVRLARLNMTVTFEAWETIHTEISRKYTTRQISKLALRAGWNHCEDLKDATQGYAVTIFSA
ncbi:MAG: L-histidine N(alpha)-methyltransferase [Acidobacteria bacterium]|nr:L-histidine N(alpha)-methyltransferase [Acidobacteriota bacterium]